MTVLTTTDYLKYANLQMAAEAFIRNPDTGVLYGQGLVSSLKRNTRFDGFSIEWRGI